MADSLTWSKRKLPSGGEALVAKIDGAPHVVLDHKSALHPYLNARHRANAGGRLCYPLAVVRADFEKRCAAEYAQASGMTASALRKASEDLAKLVELTTPKAPPPSQIAAPLRAAPARPRGGSPEDREGGRGAARSAEGSRGTQGGSRGEEAGRGDAREPAGEEGTCGMRLWAVVAHLVGEPDAVMLWTRPSTIKDPHESAIDAYCDAGGDRYVMRIAEFVEVATAPTERPPPVNHGPDGEGPGC